MLAAVLVYLSLVSATAQNIFGGGGNSSFRFQLWPESTARLPGQRSSLASRKGWMFCCNFSCSSWDLGALPAQSRDTGKGFVGSSEL